MTESSRPLQPNDWDDTSMPEPPSGRDDALLLETNNYILLEDGGRILLE